MHLHTLSAALQEVADALHPLIQWKRDTGSMCQAVELCKADVMVTE